MINGHVYYEAALTGPNQLTVAYQCSGGAYPPAAAVSIQCGINLWRGLTTPGTVSIFSEGENIPNGPFRLCWKATAFYGANDTITTSGCTPYGSAPVGSGDSLGSG